jgi:hypothetical protein
VNQNKPVICSSRPKQSARRRLFVRAAPPVPAALACFHGFQFPPGAGRRTARPAVGGGGCGATRDKKNAREIPIPPVFFLAFSPRLCPQPNARCLCSCIACSSQSSYPHRLRTNPSPSPTHQRGKKALFFSSEKGEGEKIILLSSVQSSRGHQGTEAGRRDRVGKRRARRRRGEGRQPAAALRYIGQEGSPPGEARILRLWPWLPRACFVWWRCAHWRAASVQRGVIWRAPPTPLAWGGLDLDALLSLPRDPGGATLCSVARSPLSC